MAAVMWVMWSTEQLQTPITEESGEAGKGEKHQAGIS